MASVIVGEIADVTFFNLNADVTNRVGHVKERFCLFPLSFVILKSTEREKTKGKGHKK